jgi:hypothetical protein
MGYWGWGWLLGSGLITIGVLTALAAAAFAIRGLSVGDGTVYIAAATPLAFAALALIAAGASLRWSSGCYEECCDWDERPNTTLETHAH